MQITKREFLRKLGLAGAAGVTGAAFGDEVPSLESIHSIGRTTVYSDRWPYEYDPH
mgnify:CR=1 FL=1